MSLQPPSRFIEITVEPSGLEIRIPLGDVDEPRVRVRYYEEGGDFRVDGFGETQLEATVSDSYKYALQCVADEEHAAIRRAQERRAQERPS